MPITYRHITAVFLVFLACSLLAQEPEKQAVTPFQPGEHLHYRLKYGIFTAAEADLRLQTTDEHFEGGHTAMHIVADGKTTGTFDVFFGRK